MAFPERRTTRSSRAIRSGSRATCSPTGLPTGADCSSAPRPTVSFAYEQQRRWREIWMDGRALPKAVDVKGAPESRYYGYSVGHWENDNTLVIDTTGVDERPWLEDRKSTRLNSSHITISYAVFCLKKKKKTNKIKKIEKNTKT